MQIKRNKNFERAYKDDAWRGFSVKEVISILIALTDIGLVMYFVHKWTGMALETAVYIAVPSSIPILAAGFFTYQDMSFLQLVQEIYYSWKTKILVFSVGEFEHYKPHVFTMRRVKKKFADKEQKNRKKDKRKRRK